MFTLKFIYTDKYFMFIIFIYSINISKNKMGIGDWGLGIGDWGLGTQSPIPNPQSPIPNPHIKTLFNV